MKAMIFDIDGTLADVTHLTHMLGAFPKAGESYVEYEEYHKLAVHAPVVAWVVDMARAASKINYRIFLATSRRTTFMTETVQFLELNNIPCDMMFMRDPSDDRSATDLKRDVLSRIRRLGYTVEQAFDDDPEVITMWESEGIEAFLVEGHGFDYGE